MSELKNSAAMHAHAVAITSITNMSELKNSADMHTNVVAPIRIVCRPLQVFQMPLTKKRNKQKTKCKKKKKNKQTNYRNTGVTDNFSATQLASEPLGHLNFSFYFGNSPSCRGLKKKTSELPRGFFHNIF